MERFFPEAVHEALRSHWNHVKRSGTDTAPMEDEEFVIELIGCQERLRGFLRCLLVPADDLDDLLQDTNRVLVKKARTYGPGTDFWAWASQVARFEVLAYHRRRRLDRHLFDTELINDLASRAEMQLRRQPDQRVTLEDCLNQLSDSNSRLIESRYSDGKSLQEIADSAGRPVGSIRQTLYRIRQQLRSCLELQASGGLQ